MSAAIQAGDIVRFELPQADGAQKPRPALVLAKTPPDDDLLVCGVSTQLRHEVIDFDDIIAETDADFTDSGLKKTSLIRLGFLATLPADESQGILGRISPARLSRLRSRLAHLLAS